MSPYVNEATKRLAVRRHGAPWTCSELAPERPRTHCWCFGWWWLREHNVSVRLLVTIQTAENGEAQAKSYPQKAASSLARPTGSS